MFQLFLHALLIPRVEKRDVVVVVHDRLWRPARPYIPAWGGRRKGGEIRAIPWA